jgi:REP element-mobilizing transposase RayT
VRYFITFSCYGAHLHGDASGSVDREHNLPGGRLLDAQARLAAAERLAMGQAPYSLDHDRRTAVLDALQEVCVSRGWTLMAAHVRTNHVHAIVESEVQPERIMNDFKAYASRKLNQLGMDQPGQKRWARHGSTRWLWPDQSVREAIKYVVEEQGEPMAVFLAGSI